jgi:hypothetical protein
MSSLEERVDILEFQVETLSQILADPKHAHFNQIILERKLSRADANKIYGLMDMLSENPTATDRQDFLERISELVPRYSGDATFASSVVTALNQDGKYGNVHDYLKYNDASLSIE